MKFTFQIVLSEIQFCVHRGLRIVKEQVEKNMRDLLQIFGSRPIYYK